MARSAPNTDEAGFTLVEAVVALGVFAVAAMALLSLSGESARAGAALEEAAYARIVADNQLVLALVARGDTPTGAGGGVEEQAGIPWEWSRVITPTSDPAVQRVVVEVRLEGSERVAASVVGFRRAP